MRLLFEMDKKDYGGCTHFFARDSARSIIIRSGKIAMIHSLKYDYYKFPGGGIEPGESTVDALIRETAEEAGLIVIPDSISEYGYVHRIQKSTVKDDEYFMQDNYYYLCDTEEGIRPQKLDDYESDESFTLEYVMPETAILCNRTKDHGPKDPVMLEREARVLEMILSEGLIEL
ncbi:NUDIX domain-containing protein [Oribacterium sp. oral taxon 102]|uniref:NUDIX hydrolase n=1 Tax=Oribacterium sp. oral taxon 102 TaxID=671214 RepID=UPI0015BAE6B4|nr:NUDIX domain-containing protein [Oribacterium sp. oral taxon 102]NWO20643.1 NUDIX domain-containing protein [Oribacterium sp. oral taxon 102]